MVNDSEGGAMANVARFLPRMAEAVPQQAAVRVAMGRTASGRIRYEEYGFEALNRLSDNCARYLEHRGMERGTRVLLMVRPGLELITLCFALFKLGAVPVVIDPGMGLRSFLNCVGRTQPDALIGIPAAMVISRLSRRTFQSVGIRICIRSGGAFPRELRKWDSSEAYPLARTREEDPAAILFTSGSTGPPKGVRYEHGMFEAQVRLIQGHYGIEPGEVDLPMLPVFALFNPAMGMTTVVPEMNPSRPARVNPEKIVRAILQNEVTNSFGSPVLWNKIGHYCLKHRIRLPSLKRILVAGAPVAPDLIRMFEKILVSGEIHTPYGATEALPVSSISGNEVLRKTWQKTEQGAGTCIGTVFPEMEARIFPAGDNGTRGREKPGPLPQGSIGEICVRGPVVTREYDQLPEATSRSKMEDPAGGPAWHRMGDLGYFDGEGRLWFCGRKAERVVTCDGNALYTDCCEAIFNRHPKVFRSALVGLENEGGTVEPAMVIEPESGCFPNRRSDRDSFIRELRELGSGHAHTKRITRFHFYRAFPVDVRHNAKIHRLKMKRELERKGPPRR